jgi:hypothetical protein
LVFTGIEKIEGGEIKREIILIVTEYKLLDFGDAAIQFMRFIVYPEICQHDRLDVPVYDDAVGMEAIEAILGAKYGSDEYPPRPASEQGGLDATFVGQSV